MNVKWKRWSRLLILVAVGVGATQISLERAAAIEVLDQYQENWENGFSLEATPRVTQTFRPVFGNVTAISAFLTGPASVTIRLFDALCGNLLATGTKSTDVAGWIKVNFPAPIVVVAEE